MNLKNPLRKVGGRLDVTFAEEVGQVTETHTNRKPGKEIGYSREATHAAFFHKLYCQRDVPLG